MIASTCDLTAEATSEYCVVQYGRRVWIAPEEVVNVTVGSRTYPIDQTMGASNEVISPKLTEIPKTG